MTGFAPVVAREAQVDNRSCTRALYTLGINDQAVQRNTTKYVQVRPDGTRRTFSLSETSGLVKACLSVKNDLASEEAQGIRRAVRTLETHQADFLEKYLVTKAEEAFDASVDAEDYTTAQRCLKERFYAADQRHAHAEWLVYTLMNTSTYDEMAQVVRLKAPLPDDPSKTGYVFSPQERKSYIAEAIEREVEWLEEKDSITPGDLRTMNLNFARLGDDTSTRKAVRIARNHILQVKSLKADQRTEATRRTQAERELAARSTRVLGR